MTSPVSDRDGSPACLQPLHCTPGARKLGPTSELEPRLSQLLPNSFGIKATRCNEPEPADPRSGPFLIDAGLIDELCRANGLFQSLNPAVDYEPIRSRVGRQFVLSVQRRGISGVFLHGDI